VRVLHILHTSLPHVCGYSLRSDQILSGQRRLGIDINVVSSAQQPDARPDEALDGIPHWRTAPLRLAPSPVREFQLMRALSKRVAWAAAHFKPDLIHAHSPILVGLPASRVASRLRIPFIYEVRDLWENASVDRGRFRMNSLPYRATRGLETALLRRADAVTTLGETLRQELQSRTTSAVTVVDNGVDTEQFAPVEAEASWRAQWNPDNRTLLAYIGSFQPYEGLDILFKSLRHLALTIPDVQLLIAGDGPQRAGLEQLARAEGLQDRVRFTGRVPHSRVKEIYAVADLLVYPRIETLTTRLTTPLKPLEALSMGKAVLASNLAAMRELIEDNATGLLFAAGDPADLARKAATLLQDPALGRRLGVVARQRMLQSRRWDSLIARYVPVYERALAEKR
jgi:PEP-CTERM/exosortase A-associated glycosyltransferase